MKNCLSRSNWPTTLFTIKKVASVTIAVVEVLVSEMSKNINPEGTTRG